MIFIYSEIQNLFLSSISKHFKLNFPKTRVHDFLRSYAAYLINNGLDIYLVKELIQHKDIRQTANTFVPCMQIENKTLF